MRLLRLYRLARNGPTRHKYRRASLFQKAAPYQPFHPFTTASCVLLLCLFAFDLYLAQALVAFALVVQWRVESKWTQ